MLRSSMNQFHSKIKPSDKILATNSSPKTHMFFDCCDNIDIEGELMNQIHISTNQHKISIKQLKKRKQQSFLNQEGKSRSKSKNTKTSNKTSIKNIKRKNSTKNLRMSKISLQLPKNSQIEKKSSEIQFREQKNSDNLAYNNFKSINYMVGQCLVQPQEANFIFQQNPQINATIQDQLNTIFDSKNQGSLRPEVKIYKKDKQISQQSLRQKDLKQLRSYANFSFGQRQKQEFFSKYLDKITSNMKPNQSLEESKTQKKLFQMYQIDSTIQKQLNQLYDEKKAKFLRDTFQKKSLNYLVNKVGKTIFRSQSQHTQSKESMVIDTHKSIIQKYQHSKEIHLVS